MAVARTQKEIRQRAPWWFAGLLVLQLGLMAYDAHDSVTKQRMIRVWAQALVSPSQRAATGAGSAGTSFIPPLVRLARVRGPVEFGDAASGRSTPSGFAACK